MVVFDRIIRDSFFLKYKFKVFSCLSFIVIER